MNSKYCTFTGNSLLLRCKIRWIEQIVPVLAPDWWIHYSSSKEGALNPLNTIKLYTVLFLSKLKLKLKLKTCSVLFTLSIPHFSPISIFWYTYNHRFASQQQVNQDPWDRRATNVHTYHIKKLKQSHALWSCCFNAYSCNIWDSLRCFAKMLVRSFMIFRNICNHLCSAFKWLI